MLQDSATADAEANAVSSKRFAPEFVESNAKRNKLESPESTSEVSSVSFCLVEDSKSETSLSLEQNHTPCILVENSQSKPFTQRELDRLEKQKQREVERQERERKKEEEKRSKQLERERKENERRLKKEQLELEKQAKREQERLRKEERKAKLEEEKLAKEEERKRKEEEKKKREEEKRRKDEEKKKAVEQKERNQMKISNFFAVKPSKPAEEDKQAAVKSETPPSALLYSKTFLPFFQKSNTSMGRNGSLPATVLAEQKKKFDSGWSSALTIDLKSLFKLERKPASEPAVTTSQKMVEALNSSTKEHEIVELVKGLPPVKYIQFYENAKPPFIGTWCSEKNIAVHFRPTAIIDTSLTGYNYDYDSDLDWDGEDDEGEDIEELDEDDDEEEANDDDDMDDFVDDNKDALRKSTVGPLQSVCKWNSGVEENVSYFSGYKYELLEYDISFPLDPLNDYWPKQIKDRETGCATPSKQVAPAQNDKTPVKAVIQDAAVVAELRKFIASNSDFTLGTLSELAKKEFKSYTKSVLKHTIQDVAVYNKKRSLWEIKAEVATEQG